MTARRVGWTLLAALVGVGVALVVAIRLRPVAPRSPVQGVASAGRTADVYEVGEVVYDGGLGNGWRDWGWGSHNLTDAGAARVRFSEFGGIIFHHDDVSRPFGALVFRFKAPQNYGDFLHASLKYRQLDEKVLPRLAVKSESIVDVGDGWREVLIPWNALNPTGVAFDRVVIEAKHPVGSEWVLLDKVLLTKPGDSRDGGVSPTRKVKLAIDCAKPTLRISPLIYGIAKTSAGLGETAHRVGGNPSTRLNWELGNVWNTGSDWYFENVKGSPTGLLDWIEEGRVQGVKMAVTVPMIGWVAKDVTSVGFPVSKFGAQKEHDPARPEAGNGMRPDGTPLSPGPPAQTSVAVPPELVRRWIGNIRQKDAPGGSRGVYMYILDNEPDLWNTTHRDVHPDPLTYDELLDRTLRYGTAIREADPDAVIAGPASWGWSGYFYSAKDMASGWHIQPDRRAHGGVPLLPWYLHELAEHEKKTGLRILDVVDVHFYPQAKGIYGKDGATDPDASALRLRSTRALWDPTYKDESWIGERVNLIPRLKDWIERNYPGRGISIGEWSFGAEQHINGALAIAEVLGRFGQQEVTSAFYWFDLPAGTPGFNAFRAYRDFDGKGGRFLDWSIPTRVSPGVSLFASRDDSGSHLVAIALNLDPVYANDAEIELNGCGTVETRRAFVYGPHSSAITEERAAPATGTVRELLPPYSIKVIDITATPAKR